MVEALSRAPSPSLLQQVHRLREVSCTLHWVERRVASEYLAGGLVSSLSSFTRAMRPTAILRGKGQAGHLLVDYL